MRASITPGSGIAEFRRYMRTDVRTILPSIQVPTLVLSSPSGTAASSPENGRYLASRIPGAQLVEIERPASEIHWLHWYGRAEPILGEVGRFLADLREEEASFDRVLATVLFTDLVASTEKAAELGDRGWRELVERHHATVRAMLARYRGIEVDTVGDGFFATFDGPARGIRCAQAIVDAVRPLGLEVRAGLHTGEVETIDRKAGGIAVNIGARVGALAAGSARADAPDLGARTPRPARRTAFGADATSTGSPWSVDLRRRPGFGCLRRRHQVHVSDFEPAKHVVK